MLGRGSSRPKGRSCGFIGRSSKGKAHLGSQRANALLMTACPDALRRIGWHQRLRFPKLFHALHVRNTRPSCGESGRFVSLHIGARTHLSKRGEQTWGVIR